MTKLMITTPAYDGRVHVQYAIALSETIKHLFTEGIKVQTLIHASGSLLIAERNRLNKAFLASDCTHMLCIDSDLGWPAHAVHGLLKHDKDFIAGLYPCRGENTFLFRAQTKEDKSLIVEDNLIKMDYVPAGFMLIKKCVIEKMTEHFKHLKFIPKHPSAREEDGTCLFDTEVWEGEFWGEDYTFCRRARECGFDIWVDPMIEFDHAGTRGCVMSLLTDKKPEEQNATQEVSK